LRFLKRYALKNARNILAFLYLRYTLRRLPYGNSVREKSKTIRYFVKLWKNL